MNKTEAIKKVWDLVTNDKAREAEETANRYNTFIDVEEDSRVDGVITVDENGYIGLVVREVLRETEKAVQVVFETGSVVGSGKGWKTWIPKSVIK